MMWARIDVGLCAEFATDDPTGLYHPSILWVRVPDALSVWATHDYVCVDGAVQPPTLDHLLAQLRAAVVERRKTERDRGVLIGGQRWRSDKASCDDVSTALTLANQVELAGGGFETVWKTADGFARVGKAALAAAGLAIGVFVQACFAREEELSAAIDAATTMDDALTAYAAGIDLGWPGG
ncbi:DUF4376 domain-containing protein [Azospirillum cavernae]|uniref:DUF4376 domain-containing protein n=1 Tax=Azospirillum cavernae TaxID=2320860 RepID=A0A418W4S8_9PROT|nr:DUF4376 domain-containing protein [Azospirillum cavernae]RJF85043.1 DUF4376 domain-containing protein [Azospirillum cavernae]